MQQENQFLRSLFDNAPFPYQSLDSDGRILSVNKAWQDELGYEKHEVLGRWFGDFVYSDQRESFRQRFARFLTDGRIQGSVLQLVRKDASMVYVSFHGRIAQDADTRYPRTQCMFYDLSKRSEAEEQLRASEDLQLAFMESAEEGFAILDSNLQLIYANTACAALFGSAPEELIGKPIAEISPELAQLIHPDMVGRVPETGKRLLLAEQTLPTDLGDRRFSIHGFSVCGNLGVILRDCTEADRSQRQLRESEAGWRSMAEGSPDHVFVLNKELKIEHVNHSLPGITREEMIGEYIYDFADQAQRPFVRETLQNVLRTGDSVTYETVTVNAEGKRLAYESRAVPRVAGGDRIGLVVSSRERSKRKEDELRMNRLLERQTAMASLAVGFGSDLTLLGVYRTAYQQVKAVMNPDVFIISHFDDAQDQVKAVFIVCEGEEQSLADVCRPAEGPLGEVIRSGKPLVVSDYHTVKAEAGIQRLLGLNEEETGAVGADHEGHSLPSSALLVPMRVRDSVVGVMQIQSYQQAHYQSDDADLLAGLAGITAVTIENRELIAQLKESYEGIIRALAKAIELRDPYTKQHQEGVAHLSTRIAESLGLEQEQVRAIELAANVHDIGKVIIPAEILSKPSRLSGAQMSIVQSHVLSAHEVLEDIAFPWDIDDIVVQHHERLDGSGYPHGLRGDAIRIEARILAVADVADAMMSHRPYRHAYSLDATMEELLKLRGSALDEAAVDACLMVLKQEAAQP